MPFVKIFLRRGKSEKFLRDVSDGIHAALVSEANVPVDDRFHVILELEPPALVADPAYGGVSRTGDLVIVEITLNAGRTIEIKRNLYQKVARNLRRAPGLRPDDLVISLVEVSKENWSFGKGLATYAQDPGSGVQGPGSGAS